MSGKTDQAKGKAKEIAGAVIGDTHLESEGKTDGRVGKIKEKVDHAKDTVEELIREARDKGEHVIDKTNGH